MQTKPDLNGTLYIYDTGSNTKYLLMSCQPIEHLGVKGHRFWLLDADANVLDEFGPGFDCDCEYSFHTVYKMQDGTLLKYFGKQNDCSTTSLRHWSVEVICQAQRELSREEPEAARLFAAIENVG